MHVARLCGFALSQHVKINKCACTYVTHYRLGIVHGLEHFFGHFLGGRGTCQERQEGRVERRRLHARAQHHLGGGEPPPAGGQDGRQARAGRHRAREGRLHRQGLPPARLLPRHPHDERRQGESKEHLARENALLSGLKIPC